MIFSSAMLSLSIFFIIKNRNTCKQRRKVIDAIFNYNVNCIINKNCNSMCLKELKKYEWQLFDLTDWGYEKTLPKEEFEKIKPYIK